MQKDQDLSDSFSTATSETTDAVEDTRALSRASLAGAPPCLIRFR